MKILPPLSMSKRKEWPKRIMLKKGMIEKMHAELESHYVGYGRSIGYFFIYPRKELYEVYRNLL